MKKALSLVLTAAAVLSSMAFSSISADAAAIKGDLNGDNLITLRDASIAQKIAVGLISPNENQLKGGDLNGDGVVTSVDSFIIQKYVCLDKATLDDLAPNKEEREELIGMINADRIAKGLDPFSYTDANLEAGNIRANEYLQVPKSTRPDSQAFYTVLEECNLQYNTGITPHEFAAFDYAYATDVYNTLTKYYNSTGEMYDILTSPRYTTICVGSVKDPTSANKYCWIIIAN